MSSKRHRRRLRGRRTRPAESGPVLIQAPEMLQQPASIDTEVLTALVERRRQAIQSVDAEVRRLAQAGMDWGELGRALGMTRQGARQRCGSVKSR